MQELSPASRNYKAWVTESAKQPMVFETLDPGPLGDEEVEVAVEYCGLCHSDLSVFKNEWGISQFPAVLGHEVIGRITALGSNTKARRVGQRVGVGWFSAATCTVTNACRETIIFASKPRRRSSAIAAGCFARARELGMDAPSAREAELRRCRPTAVRWRHGLQPANDARQADRSRRHHRHRRARSYGRQIRRRLRLRRDRVYVEREQVR